MNSKQIIAASNDTGANIIVVKYSPHQMAHVYVNDKHVMSGNFWDFHPGCHGFYELADKWGDFRTCRELAQSLWWAVREEGMPEGLFRQVRIETVDETVSPTTTQRQWDFR